MNAKVISFVKGSNIHNADLWVAEACFGFRHIREELFSYTRPSNILEIGCGSGILLSMLSEEFPQHKFTGIEPFGEGFSALEELNSLVRASGVEIKLCRYEEYSSDQTYDMIYCVNVFEHVDNWRHLLEWSSAMINEGGRFVVLCPNYSFPYESHFRIPVIINKHTTKFLFKSQINKFEHNNNVYGLWSSLNFVKKREVRRFVEERKSDIRFELTDKTEIIDEMVRRVAEDVEFRKRQGFVGAVANHMTRMGIFKLVKCFPNFLPYMKLSFLKTGGFPV